MRVTQLLLLPRFKNHETEPDKPGILASKGIKAEGEVWKSGKTFGNGATSVEETMDQKLPAKGFAQLGFAILLGLALAVASAEFQALIAAEPFPALIPREKPADRRLSAAVERLYDEWNPLEDRDNELFSNFKYSRLVGLSHEGGRVSRRDPSKVLLIDGVYHVWYTRRETPEPPAGAERATATVPSTDWDLAEIWHATSRDGFTWKEAGVAVKRTPGHGYGWRSVTTPDILVWHGRYYLFFQGFNAVPGVAGDRAAVTAAEADSPHGPWRSVGRAVIDFGAPDEWDANAIHDPYPLVFNGKIHVYYKGSPGRNGRDGTLIRAQGAAIADHPFGPYTKSPLNPIINSGHETCLFPFREGVAAIVSLDGPEKNTVQFASDGLNFTVKSLLQIPPLAPGPFVADAFADKGNGRGVTWGLCHLQPDGVEGRCSMLARFDCDLSLDVDRPFFKRNNLRFDERTYQQERVKLPDYLRKQIEREHGRVDRDTLKEGQRGRSLKPAAPPNVNENPAAASARAFPAVMPTEKPDRPLSEAWARMWDRWNPHEDRANELYSNFKYSLVQGFERKPNVSRRDPSKILRVEGRYYVWYTRRQTSSAPVGQAKATDLIPATDWDLADIWCAASDDGFSWRELGAAVRRPPKPEIGWRSICTPDILMWKGRYYLYFQAYSEVTSGTARCPVRVAVADSPAGPWSHFDRPPIEPGPPGSWDNIKINDPNLIVHRGRILLYYKGAPIERGDEYVLRMQGVAMADNPLGPFVKSRLNPVINSGHETCAFPWRDGVAALVSLDGPEKNTIQFSRDGENFEVRSMVQIPPVAPGPFVSDAFADSDDGRGFTWGLCHINTDGGGAENESILARFDCDLSLDVDRQIFKRNNLRLDEHTHFHGRVGLPRGWRQLILSERAKVDRETIR